MKASENQKEKVKSYIQNELLKRGFLAPIIKFEESEYRDGSTGFTFETSEFQTTPVLFKTIKVCNFSSSISPEKTHENGNPYRNIWIQVHASYTHFEGGSNGSHLFTVRGVLANDNVYELCVE